MSKINILDLPQDVIVNSIIPELDRADINSLSRTCHAFETLTQDSTVYRHLYAKTFGHNPVPLSFTSTKWPELYKLRSTGKLYTWGKSGGCRLGYSLKEVPRSHLDRRRFSVNIILPTLVERLAGSVLADVSGGGFSFQILTEDGTLYFTGSSWHGGLKGPGPVDRDRISENSPRTHHGPGVLSMPRHPLIPLPRITTMPPIETQTPKITDLLPEHRNSPLTSALAQDNEVREATGILTKVKIDPERKILTVSSGRSHFIALDDSGAIWSWDCPQQKVKGIKLSFNKPNHEPLNNSSNIITQISAGWNLSSIYVLNVGIVVWRSRDAFTRSTSAVQAHFKVVPNTGNNNEDQVIDLVALNSAIIYITKSGKCFLVKVDDIETVPTTEPVPLDSFNRYKSDNSYSSDDVKFIKLSGSFKTFAAFTDDGQVLIGDLNNLNFVKVIESLQHKDCISISVGDYHFLALLRDRTMLSWGRESQYCGCLGLGDGKQFVERGLGTQDEGGYTIISPTPISVEGQVLAIAAGGWQSAAIISNGVVEKSS
ncbi:hypothetical protein LJB42_002349 [Komagataella kurtzmanii]|nr:hypothetical protein LJB42_002349 [Komagataella kurtzmanii]